MGLGGATEKLQRVANMGEELYGKMNELREQILEVRETVQATGERVAAVENKVDQQGAILEALAEQEGIDVDAILTEVAIQEAEPAVTEIGDAEKDDAAVESVGDSEGDDGAAEPVDDADGGDASDA